MHATRVDVTVDEALARAVPAVRPLLGHRAELIVLDQGSPKNETPLPRGLTLDELLALRTDAPPGAAPLSDAAIEQAIIEGALRGNV